MYVLKASRRVETMYLVVRVNLSASSVLPGFAHEYKRNSSRLGGNSWALQCGNQGGAQKQVLEHSQDRTRKTPDGHIGLWLSGY